MNPSEEDSVTESIFFEELGFHASWMEPEVEPKTERKETLENEGLYNIDVELKRTTMDITTLKRTGLLSFQLCSKLRFCQKELRSWKAAWIKQTT